MSISCHWHNHQSHTTLLWYILILTHNIIMTIQFCVIHMIMPEVFQKDMIYRGILLMSIIQYILCLRFNYSTPYHIDILLLTFILLQTSSKFLYHYDTLYRRVKKVPTDLSESLISVKNSQNESVIQLWNFLKNSNKKESYL